jgi:integrase/recombinase XerC
MSNTLLDALRIRLLARRNAPRTIDTYIALAGEFLDGLDTDSPTRADIERFLARPRSDGQRRAPSSLNQALSALKVLSNVAVTGGVWRDDPTKDMVMLKDPPKEPNFLGREELAVMFRTAASLPTPVDRARDLALLAVLTTTGLRVHEVQALDVTQLDELRSSLLNVLGKGGTRHHIALPPSALLLLHDWLRLRATLSREDDPGMFVANTGRRWSIRTLQRHVNALAERAGITRRVAPHALRHTVGTLGVSLGIDVLSLSAVLRHGDLSSTKRYVHLATERKRAAAHLLDTLIPAEVLPIADISQGGDIHNSKGLDQYEHLDDNVGKVA